MNDLDALFSHLDSDDISIDDIDQLDDFYTQRLEELANNNA